MYIQSTLAPVQAENEVKWDAFQVNLYTFLLCWISKEGSNELAKIAISVRESVRIINWLVQHSTEL